LIAVQGQDHPALYADNLTATDLTWVVDNNKIKENLPFRCTAKVRYRQEDQKCTIKELSADNNKIIVEFDQPQRCITPSQSVVFYDKNICLGGGIIKNSGPSYYEQNKSLSLKN